MATSAAIDAPRKVKLTRLLHAYYNYRKFEEQIKFLNDFGLVPTNIDSTNKSKIYFRGYGSEPWVICAQRADADEFGGVAFEVESEDDLQYASDSLPQATQIYELDDAPGGGKCVTFYDPVDGFPFHLVHGQIKSYNAYIDLPRGPVNYPLEKNRPVNKKQRFKKGPAPVYKLGHFGLCTTDFAKTFEFYRSRFNFIPSDIVHDDKGVDMTVFWRLDRGKQEVDHHCFFFYQGPKYHVHHASFETYDFDAQVLGHDWLRERGYENCWGVGRHVLGSQIFDYWNDPSGFILEHYVDGDQVDDTEPVHRSKAAPDGLHVWGPDVPPGFLD